MKAPLFVLLVGMLALAGCKKEDRPTAWREVPVGFETASPLEQVVFASEQAGWIVGGRVAGLPGYPVLLRTTDAGQSWQRIDLRPYQVSGFRTLSAVSPMVVLASGPDLSASGPFIRRMYKSSDGGNTWRKLASMDFRGAFDIHFFSEQVGLAMTNNSIQRTTDGGDTWLTTYLTGPVGLSKLRFLSPQLGFAVGGVLLHQTNAGIMLRTTDGGITWQSIAWPHGDITELRFAPGGKGYLTTLDNRLFTSTDQGITWQLAESTLKAGSGSWFISSQEGYFGGQSGIWRTTDAGATWQHEYRLETASAVITGMAFPSERVGVAITNRGVVLRRSK